MDGGRDAQRGDRAVSTTRDRSKRLVSHHCSGGVDLAVVLVRAKVAANSIDARVEVEDLGAAAVTYLERSLCRAAESGA